jgi:cytochrome c oxidase subunit 1
MKPADAPANPWEAATLEWAVPSPPPAHNFDFAPVVYSRYPLWDIDSEEEDGSGHGHAPSAVALLPAAKVENAHAGHGDGHGIHLPAPTIYPMIFALGLNLLALAILFAPPTLKLVFLVASVVYLVVAVIGWVREVID